MKRGKKGKRGERYQKGNKLVVTNRTALNVYSFLDEIFYDYLAIFIQWKSIFYRVVSVFKHVAKLSILTNTFIYMT